jgi:hypothetical protein
MALFVLHQNVKYLFTGALLAWLVSRLALFYPEHLDSALFGPAGALAFVQVFVLQGAGGLGLGGLWPAGSGNIGDLSLVPSASPLHVGALLSAGFVDLSTDTNWSLSPLLSFGALALGGL